MRARENASISRPGTISPLAARRPHRERRDQPFGHPVRAVGDDAGRGPPCAGAVDPVVHVVDGRARRRGRARRSAHLDDLGAALRDPRDELVARASASSTQVGRRLGRSPSRGVMSGYWLAEWLPQTMTPSIAATGTPSFAASCATRAVVVEAGHRGEALDAGTSGAWALAMSAFVLAGLPTTRTRTSDAAPALIAAPCGPKMRAVRLEQVGPLHAGAARPRADEQRDVDAVEGASSASSVTVTSRTSGKAPSSSSRAVPSAAAQTLGDLEQAQVDRRVRPEQLAGRCAEEQCVADLAAGAGDGHGDGWCRHPS